MMWGMSLRTSSKQLHNKQYTYNKYINGLCIYYYICIVYNLRVLLRGAKRHAPGALPHIIQYHITNCICNLQYERPPSSIPSSI